MTPSRSSLGRAPCVAAASTSTASASWVTARSRASRRSRPSPAGALLSSATPPTLLGEEVRPVAAEALGRVGPRPLAALERDEQPARGRLLAGGVGRREQPVPVEGGDL